MKRRPKITAERIEGLGLVATVLLVIPEATATVWAVMPHELRAAIPEQYLPLAGVAVAGAGFVGHIIKRTREAHHENR